MSVEIPNVTVVLEPAQGEKPLVIITTHGGKSGATIRVTYSQISPDELGALFGVLSTSIKEREVG